jgi:hypothetical protein
VRLLPAGRQFTRSRIASRSPGTLTSKSCERKTLPPNRLKELESFFAATGKNASGKWPMKDETLRSYMGNDWVNETIKEMGYDGIQHRGGAITGADAHNVTIAFDPSQVRSANAAFDPDNIGKNNLLGGLGAAAVGLGAASQSEDADAGVVTRGGKRLIEAFHGSPHKFDRFSMGEHRHGRGGAGLWAWSVLCRL